MAEEKTQEEKDKELQEEKQKKSEARAKLIDDLTSKLSDELKKGLDVYGLQSVLKEVSDRILKIQVVAAGMQIGPTEKEKEETKLPILAPPMSDGTPVANIAQAKKPGDKPEEPKESVPKTAAHASKK